MLRPVRIAFSLALRCASRLALLQRRHIGIGVGDIGHLQIGRRA